MGFWGVGFSAATLAVGHVVKREAEVAQFQEAIDFTLVKLSPKPIDVGCSRVDKVATKIERVKAEATGKVPALIARAAPEDSRDDRRAEFHLFVVVISVIQQVALYELRGERADRN